MSIIIHTECRFSSSEYEGMITMGVEGIVHTNDNQEG